MIYHNFTTYAISVYTNRHCLRFTELAYVVVAVFDSGRPEFISKRKLHKFTICQECKNDGKLQAEWKIGILTAQSFGQVKKPLSLKTIERRVRSAGFDFVETKGTQVKGVVPSKAFERTVALQCAKENGWSIVGNHVIVSAY